MRIIRRERSCSQRERESSKNQNLNSQSWYMYQNLPAFFIFHFLTLNKLKVKNTKNSKNNNKKLWGDSRWLNKSQLTK
jgi:hypothetical protein